VLSSSRKISVVPKKFTGLNVNNRSLIVRSSKPEDSNKSNDNAQPKSAAKMTNAELDKEIISISLPMLATLAADPIAGLVDTAYLGRLGASELAGVGVALSIFNTVSKLFSVPLLSVTTSSVATAGGKGINALSCAASSSLLIASVIGLTQALVLGLGGPRAQRMWGILPTSNAFRPSLQFLNIRAIGAPITILLLTLQGIFRGLADTRATFYATVLSNAINVFLAPVLVFNAGWGVGGAAAATVFAQFVPATLLFFWLRQRVNLTAAGKDTLLQVLSLFKPTGFLILRTVSITISYAVATAMVARAGSLSTASHQICFQIWLASSLLSDSLAVAAQSLMARCIGAEDLGAADRVAKRTSSIALVLGLFLSAVMAIAGVRIPRLFTKDPEVLRLIKIIFPLLVLTQPINSQAFVWDGILYGAGGFKYAAVAMAMAAAPAVAVMTGGSHLAAGKPELQLVAVWAGLATLMTMRWFTIMVPYVTRSGPFKRLNFATAKAAEK